jgi:hypothetical protein
MHYMSIQLAHKDMPHHAKHDIESFFYVLLFITIMFTGPCKAIKYKGRCTSGIFGTATDYHDLHLCSSVKTTELSNFEMWDKMLKSMCPYFAAIKPLLVDLCYVVFNMSDDSIHMLKLKGTHINFKQKLREEYEHLPRVTPADIPDDLYALPTKPIIHTAVKGSSSSHLHTQFTSYTQTSAHSGSTLDVYYSGQGPSHHPTGTHSLGTYSMSLQKRPNNNGLIHSSHRSSASSSMSQTTMLAGQYKSEQVYKGPEWPPSFSRGTEMHAQLWKVNDIIEHLPGFL